MGAETNILTGARKESNIMTKTTTITIQQDDVNPAFKAAEAALKREQAEADRLWDVFRLNEDESLDDALNARMDAQEAKITAAEKVVENTPMFIDCDFGSQPFGSEDEGEAIVLPPIDEREITDFVTDEADAEAARRFPDPVVKQPRKTNADRLLAALIDGSHKCGHDLRVETGIKSYAALGRAATALRKRGFNVRKIRWNAPSSDMFHIVDAPPELRDSDPVATARAELAGRTAAARERMDAAGKALSIAERNEEANYGDPTLAAALAGARSNLGIAIEDYRAAQRAESTTGFAVIDHDEIDRRAAERKAARDLAEACERRSAAWDQVIDGHDLDDTADRAAHAAACAEVEAAEARLAEVTGKVAEAPKPLPGETVLAREDMHFESIIVDGLLVGSITSTKGYDRFDVRFYANAEGGEVIEGLTRTEALEIVGERTLKGVIRCSVGTNIEIEMEDPARIERRASYSVDALTPGDEASLAPVGDPDFWMD